MPPLLAKFLEYCSVSIERHTPVPGVSPNGPSPLMPLVICENIELRNIASKSLAVALALAWPCGETFFSASAKAASDRPYHRDNVDRPHRLPVLALPKWPRIPSPPSGPG